MSKVLTATSYREKNYLHFFHYRKSVTTVPTPGTDVTVTGDKSTKVLMKKIIFYSKHLQNNHIFLISLITK